MQNSSALSLNEITILGAYGTKAEGMGTSAFYLDAKNVIDAGNLLSPLNEKTALIENIYLTHSHLDHMCDIAYILDNYFTLRKKTLNILGLPKTLQTLKKHFFNDLIWPDFSVIHMHNSKEMSMKYTELELGVEYAINQNSSIEAFETDHTVVSCGYIFKKNQNAILITADTYSLENVIKIVDSRMEINSMIIECSFPSNMFSLAKESKHLTPKLLFAKLEELQREDVQLYINHIKPHFLKIVIAEIALFQGKWKPVILKDKEKINF
jgi:cAMP phosphodiesterase